MAIRIAINGYGRIGKCILRAIFEAGREKEFELVALNDTGSLESCLHLTRYDSTHGRFNMDVNYQDDHIIINGYRIRRLSDRNPQHLPWGELDVDIVLECSGHFRNREKAMQHLSAGAKKILISAPAGKDVDATVVYGVNHGILRAEDRIVSNASCTTNCLAPLVKPLHEQIGIETGLMTTIHSYTNDQMLIDANHKDVRRARSATQSVIPAKTGAAAAIGLVIPDLAGRMDGMAVRVPTPNVSLVDLSFQASRDTSVEEINQIVKTAAENELKGILGYTEEPLVSVDYNHHPASSIFDATQTKVLQRSAKVMAWYDNEWAFSNRMLDVAAAMTAAK